MSTSFHCNPVFLLHNSGAIPSSTSSAAAPFTPMSSLQRVHKDVVSTNIAEPAIPRAASYEDFLRHKDLTLSTSGSKKAESSAGGSSIRKAKSDTDVAANTLRKKIEVSLCACRVCNKTLIHMI